MILSMGKIWKKSYSSYDILLKSYTWQDVVVRSVSSLNDTTILLKTDYLLYIDSIEQ